MVFECDVNKIALGEKQMPDNITLTDDGHNQLGEGVYWLGHFLTVWDQVNHASQRLLQTLLDLHTKASYILFHSGIDQNKLRNILRAAGKLRLSETDEDKMEKLLKRWEKQSTVRNRIVHGAWRLNVEITDRLNDDGIKETKSEWTRFYSPLDMNNLDPLKLNKSQKLRRAHVFQFKDLEEAASTARKCARDINEFTDSVNLKPFIDHLPVDFKQYEHANKPPHSDDT